MRFYTRDKILAINELNHFNFADYYYLITKKVTTQVVI